MDLQPVIDRLRAALVGLRQIGGSADLDAAIEGAVATPSAFCLPLGEGATSTGLSAVTHQRIAHRFAVVHVLSNRRDAQGAAALTDLAALRATLKSALVGWVPNPSNGEPVWFTGGRLLRLDGDGRLWWADEFEYASFYRS